MPKQENTIYINLRLPADLHRRLKKERGRILQQEGEDVSLNTLILESIRWRLSAGEMPGKKDG